MKRHRGFTLIELMIVVAIIAILASIAISMYADATAKSQLSEAFTAADGLKVDVAGYYNQVGSCPSAGVGGIQSATSYGGRYVASATVTPGGAGCVITALMRSNTVAGQLRGKQVVFSMTAIDAGNAQWTCSSDASPIYLPKTCQ